MKLILSFLLLLHLCGCNSSNNIEEKYPYSLSNFSLVLKPYLAKIISDGYLGETNEDARNSIAKIASNNELLKLTRCEHPIIRSVALDLANKRNTIDVDELLINHLDDTARVSWYFQCVNYEFMFVSDYLVKNFQWKTVEHRDNTIKTLILQHNYLTTAYEGLNKLNEKETKPEYYAIIKSMAQREVDYSHRSLALSKLAEFKNSEDIPLILQIMEANYTKLDCNDYSLMTKYQDSLYFKLLVENSRRIYRYYCNDWYKNEYAGYCLLNALASYKNKQSAEILRRIFNQKPILPCYPSDTASFKYHLYEAIYKNRCSWYDDLLNVIEPIIKKQQKLDDEWAIYPDTSVVLKMKLEERPIIWQY